MNKIYIGIVAVSILIMAAFGVDIIFFIHVAESAPIVEIGGFI